MVDLATRPPSRRSKCSRQTESATVMLGRQIPPRSERAKKAPAKGDQD
jgi:hypothetical protein